MAMTITMGSMTDAGQRARAGLGQTLLKWLVRVGERSAGARAARNYAALSALSDEALAARGLRREELLTTCFRHVAHF